MPHPPTDEANRGGPAVRFTTVPSKPGIYLFKSAKERVLYVGKAKNLRSRLRSYFHDSSGLDARKASMMREVRDFSYIVTGNELEAFVLEANLIKQFKPRFNIILKDDKNYPYLKLTVQEPWPRIEVVRRVQHDGALYFGPYVPAGAMWETLDFIRRNFQVRDCRFDLTKPLRPCIQHQMKRCLAPCAGKISREEYLELIGEIRLFLNGERRDLIQDLEQRMSMLSEEMRFEEAARMRDRIRAIEKAWESQKVVDPSLGDIDAAGFYAEGSEAAFKVLFIRNGVMIGSKDFHVRNIAELPDSELMHSFIAQFYAKDIFPPAEVAVSVLPEEAASLELWLGRRKGEPVTISHPRTGKKKELVAMASENAFFTFRSKKETKNDALLSEVKDRLQLGRQIADIGAFDISNISGEEAVGAFVYWSAGDFRKARYRRLRIQTVKGIDDYAMMGEVVGRVTDNLEGELPDLVIVDGGKGHLQVARAALDSRVGEIKKMPLLIAIAKDPDRAYLPDAGKPVSLEDGSRSSLFLKTIRDEVHRFAIGYHRKLRAKEMLQSPLEKINGIGKKRRFELLKVFGSIKEIRNATVEEIARLKGFNRSIAERLLHELGRSQ
jgi:excinuclease ABC subunit C